MRLAGGLIVLALAAASCGGGGDEVLVSAASSLTDAFADIEAAFEDANPGVDVVLNMGGSSGLREQIIAGAPADVFASASIAVMSEVADAGLTEGEPRHFALNRLAIAVPEGNPGGVAGLEDFANDDLLIGLCAEPVPCGTAGRHALTFAGVVPAIDTNEPNVRALVTKIEAGELDAGIVYVTDVAATEGVAGIELEAGAEYAIALLDGASPEAEGFVHFVLSTDGRAILAEHGFELP